MLIPADAVMIISSENTISTLCSTHRYCNVNGVLNIREIVIPFSPQTPCISSDSTRWKIIPHTMAASSVIESCFVEGRRPQVRYEGDVRYGYASAQTYVSFMGIPYAKEPVESKRYLVSQYTSLQCIWFLSLSPLELNVGSFAFRPQFVIRAAYF